MQDLLGPIQDQINVLHDWVSELGQAAADEQTMPAFDYSPELAAAMEMEGLLHDPEEAFHTFWDRMEDLLDLRDLIERGG